MSASKIPCHIREDHYWGIKSEVDQPKLRQPGVWCRLTEPRSQLTIRNAFPPIVVATEERSLGDHSSWLIAPTGGACGTGRRHKFRLVPGLGER